MAKVSKTDIYPYDLMVTMLDYLLGTDANDNKKTKSFKVQALADLILSYVQENADGLDQNNYFSYYKTKVTIGNVGFPYNTPEEYEQAILSRLDSFFQLNPLTITEVQLLVLVVNVTDLYTGRTHKRKYLFPEMIGKGVYNPMYPSISSDKIELVYIENTQTQTTPEDIEDSPNVQIFDLGDITGENYFNYINTISNAEYPIGYPLTDNTKIYYFKWVDDGVTYLYYFDEANSVNSYGTYGVDGDFTFDISELVLFYRSDDVPAPLVLHPVAYSGSYNDLLNLPDLSTKADLVGGKVPASQLPSYVDDVIEVANYAALPVTGESGKIYVTVDDNKQYRWSGSVYVSFSGGDIITTVIPILSSALSTQDVPGMKTYINALNPNVVVAANEIVRWLVADTGQIFELNLHGVTVGLGQTAIVDADVIEVEKDKTDDLYRAWHQYSANTLSATLINNNTTNSLTVSGTAAAVARTGTTIYGSLPMNNYLSAGAAGSNAGVKNVNISDGSYLEGMDSYFIFANNDTATGCATTVGMYGLTAAIPNLDPTNFTTNTVLVGNDAGDTNLSFFVNRTAATASFLKIPCGADFPAHTTTDAYLFRIQIPKTMVEANRYAILTLTNIVTGKVFSYTFTGAQIPRGDANFLVTINRNNRATGVATNIRGAKIHCSRLIY